jgi:2-polyprenyl-3-methyl-5-hydroxy-6-metoxy-1,4-benzoquinol methylase
VSGGYLSTRLATADSAVERAQTARHAEANYRRYLPQRRDLPILDVGSGTGSLLDWLKVVGYRDIQGIDVDAECVAACSARHRVELVQSVEAWLGERPETFAVIVVKDVLPHLERQDVVALLSACLGSLYTDGTLLVETFNGALPSASYTLANDLTQRVAFTEHSLRQALRLAGASTIKVSGATQAVSGLRGRVYRMIRTVYSRGIRLRYGVERGFGNNPSILTPKLLAIVRR